MSHVKLGDLFRVGSSKRVLQSQWTTEGVPFYRGREITKLAENGYVDNDLFIAEDLFNELSQRSGVPQAGDIMITAIGTIGNSYIVCPDDRFYFKDASVLWLARSSDVSSEYINHWLKSPLFLDQLDRGNGATVDTLTIQKLQGVSVHVPSASEQRRIVTLLDEAFANIATAKANAEKNLQNARDLFSNYLQSIFTTKGEGWVEMPLGDIGKVSMCKRIFKDQTTPAGDIPFYKIGTFGKQPDAFIPAEIYRDFRQKYSFPNKGDVLVSAAGTVGRRVVYDGEDAYFQDSNIVWIANDQTKLLNHFLYHFYGSCDWNSTQGATIARLYNDNLRQIVIAFPQSKNDQKRIAAQLDVMTEETNRLKNIYSQKLTALDDLKKSLLHQAFSGQL